MPGYCTTLNIIQCVFPNKPPVQYTYWYISKCHPICKLRCKARNCRDFLVKLRLVCDFTFELWSFTSVLTSSVWQCSIVEELRSLNRNNCFDLKFRRVRRPFRQWLVAFRIAERRRTGRNVGLSSPTSASTSTKVRFLCLSINQYTKTLLSIFCYLHSVFPNSKLARFNGRSIILSCSLCPAFYKMVFYSSLKIKNGCRVSF